MSGTVRKKGPSVTPPRTRIRNLTKLYRGATAPARVLPDFMIIGAQKSGTTSLYNYLVEHPNIARASRKEPHFFSGENYLKGRFWYRAYFPTVLQKRFAERKGGERFITGEATPYYIFHPHAPRRVRETVPNVKLVALLRNPVDRAISQYHHEVRRGNETLPLAEAIEREPERLEGEREKMLRDESYASFAYQYHSYLARGIYVDQIKAWRDHFPEERLLILKSEDFLAEPAKIVGQTLEFLGMSGMEFEEYARLNRGGYSKIDPGLRERLVEYFRPHNERLYEYLGRDFGWDR